MRRGLLRLGGAQGVDFVLRVEAGEFLAGLDGVADIDEALDHAAADAERHRRGILGIDMPGQRDGFAGIGRLDRDRADRTWHRRLGLFVLLAGGDQQWQRKRNQPAVPSDHSGPVSAPRRVPYPAPGRRRGTPNALTFVIIAMTRPVSRDPDGGQSVGTAPVDSDLAHNASMILRQTTTSGPREGGPSVPDTVPLVPI